MKNLIIVSILFLHLGCNLPDSVVYDIIIEDVTLFNGFENLGIVNIAVNDDSAAPLMLEESVSRLQPGGGGLRGLWAILVKEFYHIRRQPTTLFFMLLVPVIQTIIFGYAINTQIENIPTVVLNLDGRLQSQLLIEAFSNTGRFKRVEQGFTQHGLDFLRNVLGDHVFVAKGFEMVASACAHLNKYGCEFLHK